MQLHVIVRLTTRWMSETHTCMLSWSKNRRTQTHSQNLCSHFCFIRARAHMNWSSIVTQTFLGLRRQLGLRSSPESCARSWHLLLKDIMYFPLGLSSQQETECFHQCVSAAIALAAAQPHLCLSPPDTASAVQELILKAEAQRLQHCGGAALNEITGCEGRKRVAKSSSTIKRKVISLQLSAQRRCREVCTSPCDCLL